MKRIMSILCFAALFSLSASALEIGAGGGAYIPTGKEVKDIYDTGWSTHVFTDFNLVSIVDLRLLGNFYEATGKDRGVSQRLRGAGGGAMVMVKPELGIVKPYIGAGYMLNRTEWGTRHNGGGHHSGSQSYADKKKEWGGGLITQAGVGFKVKMFNLGLYSAYFMNRADSDELGGVNLGATASVSF